MLACFKLSAMKCKLEVSNSIVSDGKLKVITSSYSPSGLTPMVKLRIPVLLLIHSNDIIKNYKYYPQLCCPYYF